MGDEQQARRWALQLRFGAQNGSLLGALQKWRKSVDLEFEGVEPCPICYGVLHPKSKRLPHLECRQCHAKFHSYCLQHWFKTSHKNLCVVCQTEFKLAPKTAKVSETKAEAPQAEAAAAAE